VATPATQGATGDPGARGRGPAQPPRYLKSEQGHFAPWTDELHEQLVDLARTVWRLSALVVDATRVGAGLASFLADQLGRGQGRFGGDGSRRVIVSPFLLNRKTKSDLGWAFIALIDGGRIKEYADDGSDITRIYRHQLAACTFEVLPGPGKPLRWSVPASRGHDDLLISTALTVRLDEIDWRDRMARGHAGP
jgi:hypothetical protein